MAGIGPLWLGEGRGGGQRAAVAGRGRCGWERDAVADRGPLWQGEGSCGWRRVTVQRTEVEGCGRGLR